MNNEANSIEQVSRLSTLAEHVKGSGPAVLLATAALASANLMRSPEIAEAAPQCTTTISGDIQTIHCVDPETGSETTSTQTVQNNETQTTQPKPVAKAPESKAKSPAKEKPKAETKPRKRKERTTKRHRFINYDQYDGSSCGPTAMAMVSASLNGKRSITPQKMAGSFTSKYYFPGRGGTDERVFTKVAPRYGLSGKKSNFNGAKNSLNKGGLAIIHARPGHFTSRGHFIVLKGYKNGKFKLADPNRRGKHGDSENRPWSAGQLKRGGIDKVWTFRKK